MAVKSTTAARVGELEVDEPSSWVDDDWKDYVIALESEISYVNLLVYGESGVGKTVFGGSDDRVLFIAPEDKGTISAKRLGSKAVKRTITSWEDIDEVYKKLFEAGESEKGIPFDWIVIDSATRMQKMAMRSILDAACENNPERDPDIPQIQEWLKYYEMFKRFVLAFNELPVNVLYTALVTNKEDEEGTTYLAPDLQGSVKNDISAAVCSYMTSYGCMQVKRRKIVKEGEKDKVVEFRRITWKNTGLIQGKDRTQVLAPFTDGKSLKDIRLMIEAADLPADTKTPELKAAVKAVATNQKETASA